MEPSFDAVMLDLDGTLINTLPAIAAAGNHTLGQLSRRTHPIEAYRQFVGRGQAVLIRQMLGPDHLHLAERATALHREAYARLEPDLAHPYPDIPQLLHELGRRGLKLAVLSNKPHDATRQSIRTFLPDIRFDAVYGHRAAMPLKPDPAAALGIAKELGASPPRWLFLGDSDIDMHTAVAAGMSPVGAAWGFRDREQLDAAGARAIIDQPMQLLTLLVDTPQHQNR